MVPIIRTGVLQIEKKVQKEKKIISVKRKIDPNIITFIRELHSQKLDRKINAL